MRERKISIIANDGDLKLEIAVTITPRKGYTLETSEMDEVEKKAGRLIAGALTNLPFCDFGVENVRIKGSR